MPRNPVKCGRFGPEPRGDRAPQSLARGGRDGAGDVDAARHDELRRIARRCLYGERANHSVQATELVNEAFLRLVDVQHVDWQNRTHFLAMSARLMRRVLVDLARSKGADKRGGGAVRVTLDDAAIGAVAPDADVIRLDDALQALATLDDRKSRVVELRFFGGLTVDETASRSRSRRRPCCATGSSRGPGCSGNCPARPDVTPERLREIERLFHEARERPPPSATRFSRARARTIPRCAARSSPLLAQPPAGMIDAPVGALWPARLARRGAAAPGRRLGVFEVQGLLGVGGMGEVYRARDSRLGREVAIKILPRAFKDDPDRLARFEREARVLASLNHPHIGAIYGLEEAGDVTALVMELVEGEDLAQRIARGRIPIAEALPIAARSRSPRSGARAGHHPSRPEAREHQGAPGRHGEGIGLSGWPKRSSPRRPFEETSRRRRRSPAPR
jgi:RNA polymerase sigma factor (TIGR02999 family)